MRIAIIITGLGMGGAENVVASLADSLVVRGHNILIVYLTGEALVLPKNKTIRVVGLGMNSCLDIGKSYFKLATLLRDFNPDVIHSHMFHANILARLVRMTVNVPRLICTAHSTNEGGKIRMLASV